MVLYSLQDVTIKGLPLILTRTVCTRGICVCIRAVVTPGILTLLKTRYT